MLIAALSGQAIERAIFEEHGSGWVSAIRAADEAVEQRVSPGPAQHGRRRELEYRPGVDRAAAVGGAVQVARRIDNQTGTRVGTVSTTRGEAVQDGLDCVSAWLREL